MFFVGIFTTHIPYLVLVVFYAYFLIFGIENAHEGKIVIAEKSVTNEYHLNGFEDNSISETGIFYLSAATFTEQIAFNEHYVRQKWKVCRVNEPFSQAFICSNLFSRPPPQLA